MTDQATTLRSIVASSVVPSRYGEANSFAITSGKGGVGKSSLAVNLALALGELGDKVCLLDADFGLANADLICGVSPKFHLGHVVKGLKDLSDITIALSTEVDLIPAGSGISELANFSEPARTSVLSQVQAMADDLDFLLIDTATGISEMVMDVLASASVVIVVLTAEPTSIVDAYATIKGIERRSPSKPISIVVNNIYGVGDAEETFRCIDNVVRRFLGRALDYLGMIPHDPQMHEAICEQIPVVFYAPESPSSRAIRLIARHLHRHGERDHISADSRSFWANLQQTPTLQN